MIRAYEEIVDFIAAGTTPWTEHAKPDTRNQTANLLLQAGKDRWPDTGFATAL